MSRQRNRNVKPQNNQPSLALYPEPPPSVRGRVLDILGGVARKLCRQYPQNHDMLRQVEVAISLLESEE